jgi:hypothetical protein
MDSNLDADIILRQQLSRLFFPGIQTVMAVGPIIRARRATISSALAIWRAYTTRIQLATVILYHSVVASQTGMAESFTTAHWEGVDFSYGKMD